MGRWQWLGDAGAYRHVRLHVNVNLLASSVRCTVHNAFPDLCKLFLTSLPVSV